MERGHTVSSDSDVQQTVKQQLQRTRRVTRKLSGTCTSCGKRPCREDALTCRPCTKNKARYQSAMYLRRKLESRCTYCGKPCCPDSQACRACVVEQARLKRLRRPQCACGATCSYPRNGAPPRCSACYHAARKAGLAAGTWKHNWRTS